MEQPIVDYTFMQNTVWRLKAKYPVLRVKHIGKSVVGRSIYALELGRDNAPAVLFLGTFLGTDRISGKLLLQFMNRLLNGLTGQGTVAGVNPLAMIRDRKIAMIPFVNPDGREICERGAHCGGVDSGRIRRLSDGDTTRWDANARGVDITRNFDFFFDNRKKRMHSYRIYGPGARGYCGPSPESEPETAAVTQYCRHQTVRQAVALYPGSGRVLWRCAGADGQTAEQMAHMLALISGYELEASVGCMVDTGFRNWFCTDTGCPAVDVMLQPFAHPAAAQSVTPVLEEMLTVACLI